MIFLSLYNGAKLQFYSKNKKLCNLDISQPIEMRFGISWHLLKVLWHTKSHTDRLRNERNMGLDPFHQTKGCLKWGSKNEPFLSLEAIVPMHWLHVYPNSDSSTFRHFFGKFLEEFRLILCRYLADILPENTKKFGFCHFLADILHLADFQHFLGKFLANIWKERRNW